MGTTGTILLILASATLLGYGTNWLAVQMLFRPREPKYLFGRRLPMTPGVIPRQREHIIESIASGVATELVTPEAIKRELDEAQIMDQLEVVAREAFESLSQEQEVLDDLQATSKNAVNEYVSSDDFRTRLTAAIEPLVDGAIRTAFGAGAVATRTNPAVAMGIGLLGARVVEKMSPKVSEWLSARLSEQLGQASDKLLEGPQSRQLLRDLIRSIPEKGLDPEGPYRERVEAQIASLRDEFVERLDVRSLVIRKLTSYRPEQIESLILRATREHLWHIELLGGVIGFLIGLVQVLAWQLA